MGPVKEKNSPQKCENGDVLAIFYVCREFHKEYLQRMLFDGL